MASFAESFWGDDICSTDGFDAVAAQLHNGRQLCKSIEEYIKQRAKMEEDYGKAMMRLAHSSLYSFQPDDSSLLSSWLILRQQTEEIAQSHLNLSKSFNEQQARLASLMADQKRYRKPVEDELRKLQVAKRDAYKKLQEMKRNYHKRCKESDLHGKLTSGTMALKEKDKMQMKQLKMAAMADAADKSYSESVESLNMVLNEWEMKMQDYLTKAEEMDTNRVICLRNEMWELCNFVSITCVRDDECCEKARNSLVGCSEVRDIRDFVMRNGTGGARPGYLQYENYYSRIPEV